MDNSIVKNIQPLGFQWPTMDPFLFCVHHHDFYPMGNEKMEPVEPLKGRQLGSDFDPKNKWRMYHGMHIPGFPVHPHRGFETVTVVTKGLIDHFDSLGGTGRFGEGDVQWMTAGKGVQHCEMFPLVHTDKENTLELFQIWLNLPKANKFANPYYTMLWNKDIPVHHHTDANQHNTKIKIIAGTTQDKKTLTPPPDSWAANSNNNLAIWLLDMDANATYTLPKTETGITRMFYFFEGAQITIKDVKLQVNNCAQLKEDEDLVLLNGNSPGRILVLQARPINEPVVQYGPFVMNTREEIQQAYADYQRTQFGGWPWPVPDPVHERTLGTFAKYPENDK